MAAKKKNEGGVRFKTLRPLPPWAGVHDTGAGRHKARYVKKWVPLLPPRALSLLVISGEQGGEQIPT